MQLYGIPPKNEKSEKKGRSFKNIPVASTCFYLFFWLSLLSLATAKLLRIENEIPSRQELQLCDHDIWTISLDRKRPNL